MMQTKGERVDALRREMDELEKAVAGPSAQLGIDARKVARRVFNKAHGIKGSPVDVFVVKRVKE